MTNTEFSIIERFFARRQKTRSDVVLGIGDDCALLAVPAGKTLAVSMDLLVCGVHFRAADDPAAVGHKALAVNLSDLAAQGAEPAWATLGLALPAPDEIWLSAFCDGFFALADRYAVQLVGGDTTRGPLTIAVQVHGFTGAGKTGDLRRDGACPGDHIFVTGTLGDAGLALQHASPEPENVHFAHLLNRLQRPTPRVQQGLDLRGVASAAIDISDGLAQDLGHILQRSGSGAILNVDALPLSAALRAVITNDETGTKALGLALSAGDDYELCFTVPPARLAELERISRSWDCGCTPVGLIETEPGLRCSRGDGSPFRPNKGGYEHFS